MLPGMWPPMLTMLTPSFVKGQIKKRRHSGAKVARVDVRRGNGFTRPVRHSSERTRPGNRNNIDINDKSRFLILARNYGTGSPEAAIDIQYCNMLLLLYGILN